VLIRHVLMMPFKTLLTIGECVLLTLAGTTSSIVSNDKVLRRTVVLDVTAVIRKRRLGLFDRVPRLPRRAVSTNQILRICIKARDGERPSQEWRRTCGRPHTTWIHQIGRDTGVTATEALEFAEDRSFWRMIATAGGFG